MGADLRTCLSPISSTSWAGTRAAVIAARMRAVPPHPDPKPQALTTSPMPMSKPRPRHADLKSETQNVDQPIRHGHPRTERRASSGA